MQEKNIKVEYFAVLSQDAGKGEETIATKVATLQELFKELNHLYQFSLSQKQIKAAINNQVAPSWDAVLSDGDHVFFLAPLAGG